MRRGVRRPGAADSAASMPACPTCGASHVLRVRREGVVEKLLSVAYVYPFRCQLCGRRFRAMQWGRRYEFRPADRRQYERLTTRAPIDVRIGPELRRATLTEISIDGGTVETSAPMVPGQAIPLEILDAQGGTVSIEQAVIRTILDQRLGVQFVGLSPEGRAALRRVVLELLSTPRPPALPPSAPKDPP